jgi:predicted ester cyclase
MGSPEETNEDRIRRYFNAMELGTVEAAVAFWATDASNQASGRAEPGRGRQSIAAVFRMLRGAFPDRHYQIDDLIAVADQVVCRLTVSGTFGVTPPRPPFPVPATFVGVEASELIPASAAGKTYSVKHIHIFRLKDGLITDHWAARDDLGLLLQLGGIEVPRATDTVTGAPRGAGRSSP